MKFVEQYDGDKLRGYLRLTTWQEDCLLNGWEDILTDAYSEEYIAQLKKTIIDAEDNAD